MVSLKLVLKTLVMVIITAGYLDAAPLQDANKVSDESTKRSLHYLRHIATDAMARKTWRYG